METKTDGVLCGMTNAESDFLVAVMKERRGMATIRGYDDHPDVVILGPGAAAAHGVPTQASAWRRLVDSISGGRLAWMHLLVERVADVAHAASMAGSAGGAEKGLDEALARLTAVTVAWADARARRHCPQQLHCFFNGRDWFSAVDMEDAKALAREHWLPDPKEAADAMRLVEDHARLRFWEVNAPPVGFSSCLCRDLPAQKTRNGHHPSCGIGCPERRADEWASGGRGLIAMVLMDEDDAR